MKAARRFGFLLELVMLAAGLATGGPVADGIRVIAVVVGVVVGALVVFVAAVFAVAVLDQKKPPYPMEPGVWP